MKITAVLFVLVGMVGCGASSTPPAASASSTTSSEGAPSGATSKQAQDESTRKLTHDECISLGESIKQSCEGTNTRSSQIEGWCSDVATGVSTGSWTADCEKHVRYMDAVCITNNASLRSMMDCDASVQR